MPIIAFDPRKPLLPQLLVHFTVAIVLIVAVVLLNTYTYLSNRKAVQEVQVAQLPPSQVTWAEENPSPALTKALALVQARSTVVTGVIGSENIQFLLLKDTNSGSTLYKNYSLWTVHEGLNLNPMIRLEQGSSVYNNEPVTLERKNDNAVLTIGCNEETARCEQYEYNTNWLLFSFKKEAWAPNADITLDHQRYSISMLASACEGAPEKADGDLDRSLATATVSAFRFGSKEFDIAPRKFACIPAMGPWILPMFTFGEYDSHYSILTLLLPDKTPVLFRLSPLEMVPSKILYNQPCLKDAIEKHASELIRTTPETGEVILVGDITKDPVLSKIKSAGDACLHYDGEARSGSPSFRLRFNFAEGYEELGLFEFDMKSKMFKAVK